MTDNQRTESGTERMLRLGTLALTVLGPVLNTLAARLADRLERGGKPQTKDLTAADIEALQKKLAAKQPLSDALRERGEVLVQELEELVERGTKLSQSLAARSGEVTHELAERGNTLSQDLLRRSEEIRKDLGKRGKKLNKDLSKRSAKVAGELSQRSKKVTKELSKRSRQATRQISERSGTFWIVLGFVVGLAAAGIAAYVLIKQRVQQQQRLEEEQQFSLPQNGYVSTPSSVQGKVSHVTPSAQVLQPTVAEESVPAIAVAEQQNAQLAPSNAVFVGVVGSRRYYPVSTPLEQLAASETGVIYFTTEEEALGQGYSSGM